MKSHLKHMTLSASQHSHPVESAFTPVGLPCVRDLRAGDMRDGICVSLWVIGAQSTYGADRGSGGFASG